MPRSPWAFPEEDGKRILEALKNAGAEKACARCGSEDFLLADGYVLAPVHPKVPSTSPFGLATIPTAAVICVRCGAVNLHALGVLGLLPPKPQEEESAPSEVAPPEPQPVSGGEQAPQPADKPEPGKK